MALGTRFIRAGFGIKVKTQVAANTYIAADETLCLEKGKATLPTIDYSVYTCSPIEDIEYDFITDGESAKVTIPLDLALPVNASLGGVSTLLKACGFTETDDLGDLHYAPTYDLPAIGCSVEVTTKRRVYQVKDVKGTCELEMTPNEPIRIKFNMTGTLNAAPTELASGASDNTIPHNDLGKDDILYGKKNCGVTIGANQVHAKSVMVDLGRQIQTEDTSCGVAVLDSGMKPNSKITMKVTELNEAAVSDLVAGTEFALTAPGYDSSNVNKFTFTAPRGMVTADSATDSNGYWDTERTFTLRNTSGDDSFELAFLA